MFTSLQTRLKRASRWLPVALLPLVPLAAQAQVLNYAPANAVNVAGTYTDLGTTGTVITTTNTDDANSTAQPIGFNFSFNGTTFTQFVLNTNGFIKLGATAPSAANLYYAAETTIGGDPFSSTNAADVNILAPFNVDLLSGTSGAEYRVFTTAGTSGRVCTIQWKNVKDKTLTNPTQYDNFSFQLKLYEGTNNIEFVYGPTVASTGTDAFRIAAVGIKGSGSGSGQTVMANKTSSAAAWSTTVFITGAYSGSAHNYRRTAPADAGRTYRFVPSVLFPNDAAVTSLYTLGKVSSTYGSPVSAQVVVANAGSAAQTNLVVTLTVSGATTYTGTQTVASLAPGASTTVTFTYPVTATTGTNTVTATVPTDDQLTNNSKTYSQLVTAANLSYIDASQPLNATGVGIGAAPATGVLATKFTIAQASTVVSVTPSFVNAGAGATTYQVVLYDATGTGGTPGTLLYTSPTQTRPTATASPVIAVPNIAIPAGSFYVGIKELDLNLGIGYQVEDPLRPNTFYYQVSTAPTTWNPITSTTLKTRLAVEVGLGSNCPVVTALTATNVTTTGATITFTPAAGASGYTVTYTAGSGTPTTVTPAPTGSPFTLTGLTPGTAYTVSVTTNCGTTPSAAATTTFTTPTPPPPYATLPYVQDFEAWVNGASTRDLPGVNWRNTPATGDNSWRREDEGFTTASWQYASVETSANPPYRIRFSTGAHSARFHTYGANNGAQGKLDLYVDLSGTSTAPRMLSFDYINPTGLDKLEVFLSTDGGATFSTTPLLTATTNAAFTSKSVAVPGTSATSVLRFQATADLLGDDDIGLDNLRLALVTATRNEALAATVGLYPNPAHQRFTLSVPAGRLTTASATLLNALGQVVRTQPLALPATGGTAEVDVRGLAAGVYSLRLQTADALVVKQLVVE